MARFLMRMVNFVAMATYWKYMDFVWPTWKYKDFPQVPSGHYKRLHNAIPRLEKCLEAMKASSKKEVLNRNQCVHLLDKLILAMRGIDNMFSSVNENLQFQSIFEELYCLQKKIEIVRQICIEEKRWCHSAVLQLQSMETFRELLIDLKRCYNTATNIYLFHHPNQSNNVSPIQFDAATYEQVLEDKQELKKRLEEVAQEEFSEDYEIAQHLLLRLRNLNRVDGGDLDALEVPNDFKTPQLLGKVGARGYGDVYKSNWLGLACATKVLKGDYEYLKNCQKEAGILAGLSHPNLVQFFGCGITKKVDENLKEEGIGVVHLVMQLTIPSFSRMLRNLIQFFSCLFTQKIDKNSKEQEMHLVMELMESNLSTLLKKAKRPLPYLVAIDIMHQIAKGVCYLHDMQVAHLDLKPDNVLYSSIPMEDLDPCRIFKVMDYGTSQLEVSSNPEHPESPKYTIGTRGYMAPEMIQKSKTPRYPFRADVWSFAMICSEILSGKVPYADLKSKAFYDEIQGTHGSTLRPDLPNDCEGLTILIQECWSQDPLQRPTFSKICDTLANLKKSFLVERSCASRDFKSMVNHVSKVETGPPKEILVDLDHQLSKAKGLLKKNFIGIVGMGGSGKTTLAKAVLDDASVKSTYHKSCFIAECKDYEESYDLLYQILPKLGNRQKPKILEDAQEMMKKLLVEEKVLLILDDIKNESQVHDIVPPTHVQANKGTTIIITTREWNTIKSFVGIEGKLDIELLNEKAATTLFTTHLSWGVDRLSPEFEDLRKYVVKACNGLPLSLKVMGAFLRHKERLRSWERALQRMARGRSLDGDEAIWNTLRISFDGLNDGDEKNMFLDVACFFCRDVYPCGISKATLLSMWSMWSKDGMSPVDGLERLIDMSLLKVTGKGEILKMHDQLRDMGRMLAKNTRIWNASMIPESGFSSKDVEDLVGISLQGTMNYSDSLVQRGQILYFQKLRVLILDYPPDNAFGNLNAHVDNLGLLFEIASQSSQLMTILIGNSQMVSSLPQRFPTIIAATLGSKLLDLCGTSASLEILDGTGLELLYQIPHKFSSRNTLLIMNVRTYSSLASLPKEVGNLSSLTTLNLCKCTRLTTLPMEVENLSSLTTLNLSECSSLASLPKEVRNLSSLTTLNLSWCSSLVALPEEVGNLSSLTTLNLSKCSSLVALPREVGNLSSLTTLNLSECSSLVALPMEVGNLSSLTTLDLSQCWRLVALPKEVGNLSCLTTLDLRFCSSLASLPIEVGNLSCLTILNFSHDHSQFGIGLKTRRRPNRKEVENLFKEIYEF